jgi:hypothetical protein
MDKKPHLKNKTKEMFDKIVNGVNDIIVSGEYAKFLKFSKNFHHYSFNNLVLIYSQMENATKVAGFKTWQKMGRKLKKGAKGIQIMFPIKKTYKQTKIDGQASLIDNNVNTKVEEVQTIEYFTYRPTYVFDISQTTGEPLPLADTRLNTENMQDFFTFLSSFSPYPILEKNLEPALQGYWSKTKQHIVLNSKQSIDDKTSTLLHELTHALYDDFNYKDDRNLSETFVESVAFIVADYFGLDTSKCSFNYITSWANGDIKVILELGDKIQKTANQFINQIKQFQEQGLKIIS